VRIVVFGPNLVGDGVMATPALRALRARWPEARIDAVLRPAVAATLAGNPTIDGVIPFDPRGDDPARTARGVVARLREDRPDLAVLLPNSFRSAWMAWRGGSRRRAGYDRGGRRWLLTDRLKPPLDRRGRFAIVPTVAY
jgi:heptosyltransferase-2